jgi:DNA-binding MltR family transcriptional regulator
MAKTYDYATASHWDDVLQAEFAKESDRAAVILTASLFDNALGQILRSRLVASPSSQDELLDGANAPLSTFSARINVAYRLGLISKTYCRDLHLIRAIRNHFAHNVTGCTFQESSVRSRILELARSSGLIDRNPTMRTKGFPAGPRGDFLFIASWMLFSLNRKVEECRPFTEATPEFGYSEKSKEEAIEEKNK